MCWNVAGLRGTLKNNSGIFDKIVEVSVCSVVQVAVRLCVLSYTTVYGSTHTVQYSAEWAESLTD